MRHVAIAIIAAVLAIPAVGFSQDNGQSDNVNLQADNVVVVLDSSGSMDGNFYGGTRMSAAKNAIRTVVQTLPKNVNIGILTFEGWIVPISPIDMDRINEALLDVRPSGTTPLGRAIKLGADALLVQRQMQRGGGTYRLVIVTDGAADNANTMNDFTLLAKERGINIDAIGVDMGRSHSLSQIAHTYRDANNPEEFETAVKAIFAEVGADGDSQSAQEDFDIVSAFSDESALAAVREYAIAQLDNRPLQRGGYPKALPPTDNNPTPTGNSGPSGSATPAPPASSGGCSVIATGTGTGISFGTLIFVLFLFWLLFVNNKRD